MINFFLQGKGGCGKTTTASFYTQYLQDKYGAENVFAYDIDPVNASLHDITGLNARIHEIMNGDDLQMRKFDGFIEEIIGLPSDKHVVVDFGASAFQPVTKYMYDQQVYGMLAEQTEVIVHTPIVGGAAANHTIEGFGGTICERTPDEVKLVVWLNDYLERSFEEKVGVAFNVTKIYKKFQDRIIGLIRLKYEEGLYRESIQAMTEKNVTFDEAMADVGLMDKRRLQLVKEALWSQLDEMYEQL